MQVVVELPRLVPDPQVVLLRRDQVMEEHEVRQQDLVHPPPCLEAVQVVLGGLGLDMARLVGKPRARRVDPLAARLEHGGHRMLRQPVDLEVGVELAQLVGDRGVALGVAEPDRRGDVERAPSARTGAPPGGGGGSASADELAQQQVDLHRVARRRYVARVLQRDQLATSRLGKRRALGVRADEVFVTVDHERRAAHARADLPEALRAAAQPDPSGRVGERLGVGLERPTDAVLDLLARVRLAEALGEEELEEGEIVALPVVAVVLGP